MLIHSSRVSQYLSQTHQWLENVSIISLQSLSFVVIILHKSCNWLNGVDKPKVWAKEWWTITG